MSKLRMALVVMSILASWPIPVLAQDPGSGSAPRSSQGGFPRFIWFFDGRDDVRDFPTNGFFPGDFAANPAGAMIGAAGIFGSNPTGPGYGYPPQATVASRHGSTDCTRRHRSYHQVDGTFFDRNGARRAC
jgi:BA14K-like protein